MRAKSASEDCVTFRHQTQACDYLWFLMWMSVMVWCLALFHAQIPLVLTQILTEHLALLKAATYGSQQPFAFDQGVGQIGSDAH